MQVYFNFTTWYPIGKKRRGFRYIIMDLSYVWAGNSYVNNRFLNCYIQFHIIHLSRMNSPHTLFRIKNSSSQTERNVKTNQHQCAHCFCYIGHFLWRIPRFDSRKLLIIYDVGSIKDYADLLIIKIDINYMPRKDKL